MAPLNALDRCDRCGAQAYVTVDSLAWLSSLLFCALHYAEHRTAVTQAGVEVLDERPDEMKWREVTP